MLRFKQMRHFWCLIATFVIGVLIPIAVYNIRLPYPMNEAYVKNMVMICKDKRIKTGGDMLNASFKDCGYVGMIFGMLTAIWIMEPLNYRYLYGAYVYPAGCFFGTILRVIVEIIPAALLCYWFKQSFFKGFKDPTTFYLVKMV